MKNNKSTAHRNNAFVTCTAYKATNANMVPLVRKFQHIGKKIEVTVVPFDGNVPFCMALPANLSDIDVIKISNELAKYAQCGAGMTGRIFCGDKFEIFGVALNNDDWFPLDKDNFAKCYTTCSYCGETIQMPTNETIVTLTDYE